MGAMHKGKTFDNSFTGRRAMARRTGQGVLARGLAAPALARTAPGSIQMDRSIAQGERCA